MKAVNVAELKNNLSLYLRKVKAGQEIIVRDRNVPVAKIIPWQGEQDEELLAMAAKGLIRLGKGQIDDEFWDMPAPQIDDDVLRRVLEEEREGR